MAILQRPFSEGEPVRRLKASCAADCPAPAEYDPTVEDAYTLTSTVDGIEYAIELVDTAGQEEYRFALDATAREADGFILACVRTWMMLAPNLLTRVPMQLLD